MKPLSFRWFGLFLVGIFLLSSSAFTAASKSIRINPAAASPNQTPVVARVYFADLDDLNRLVGWLDVWEVNHTAGYLVAMLSPLDQQFLLQAGYQFEIDLQRTAELTHQNTPLPGQLSGIPGYPCYRTVEETYTSLEQLASEHPDLVTVIDIGDSWEKSMPDGLSGYDIYSAVITNQAIPGPKPKFFLMAAIHAREYATAELATRFAEYLVINYGVDPDITWLLDYYEIHIVPQTNPDGRKIAEGGTYWRKNTDNNDGCSSPEDWGVDLNRNSSFMWANDNVGSSPFSCEETYRGPSAASEPETQAIQNYVASIFPDQRGNEDDDPAPDDAMGSFISLHSYGPWVLFPWGWDRNPAPNDSALETLGRKFGFFNNYKVCQSGEPRCIYQTNGTTDDWAYGDLGLAAYTFEIGTTFFQSCSYFENTLIPENLPALLFAFKAARLPYQNPAGPETLELALDNNSVPSGSLVTLTATADDTRFDSNGWGDEPTQSIQAARFSIDAPSWESGITFPLEAKDGSFDASAEGIQATVNTTCLSSNRHILFVESQDASGNWGVPSAIYLNIEDAPYSTCLQPFESSLVGLPGETISFTFTLTNLGTLLDTFDIQISGNAWETIVSENQIGPLAPGENFDFEVVVTIPSDITPGISDIATITAISQADSSKTASALAVTSTKLTYDFELNPVSAEASARSGMTVTYELTITNTGSQEDSYTSTLEIHDWETTVTMPDFPLQSEESAQVVITVAIPPDSSPGTFEPVEITFTSQGDPNHSVVVNLTTRVDFPGFLPLINR